MAAYVRQRPPSWFWLAAGVIALWGAIGCIACYMQVTADAASLAALPAYDRALHQAMPAWYNWVYAVAVGSGLLGGIALLMRKQVAKPLFVVSLIAVVVQFGYIFATTDLLAVKGASAALFPLFILIVAVVQIWFADYARQRGWVV